MECKSWGGGKSRECWGWGSVRRGDERVESVRVGSERVGMSDCVGTVRSIKVGRECESGSERVGSRSKRFGIVRVESWECESRKCEWGFRE